MYIFGDLELTGNLDLLTVEKRDIECNLDDQMAKVNIT